MPRKLLQKYDIPLSHLDFEYVKKTKNTKELERIVKILRSGEEGYYPDLTQCAEDKLKELMPHSKMFLVEDNIITENSIDKQEWEDETKPINDWSDQVKLSDNFLATIANDKSTDIYTQPIRHLETQKINMDSYKNKETSSSSSVAANKPGDKNTPKQTSRIQSTDYAKWDKFDADTEILKMDLDEERTKENVEIMNKKNLRDSDLKAINTIPLNQTEIFSKLTNIEKEKLSISYKDRGNDYFKVQEYDTALIEYNKCIEMFPTANGYNNRAITYLKLRKYLKCIEDCDECLHIESNNIKAMLRKAQAYIGLNQKREALNVYTKVLSIEPSNIIARTSLNNLKAELPELPPENATRLQIVNEDSSKSAQTSAAINTNSKPSTDPIKPSENRLDKSQAKQPKSKDQYVQEDLSKLIMPKKIVKNKFASSLEAMKNQKPFPTKNYSSGDHHPEPIQFHPKLCNSNQSPLTKLKLIPDQKNCGDICTSSTNNNNHNLKSEKPLIQEIK